MEKAYYDTLHGMQARHWWYEARRRILRSVLQGIFAEGVPTGVLYDLGCGVGANLPVLEQFGETLGVDTSPEAVAYCRENGHTNVRVSDLNRLDGLPDNSASVVVLADVIEHLEDENPCLASARRLLKPGGALVVTVPAFMFLWSPADDLAHHYRRYTRAQLERVIEAHAQVTTLTYFNTILFPTVVAGRLLEKVLKRKGDDTAGVPPQPLNELLTRVFALESSCIGRVNLPFGVSLLCIARAG
ncbi:MAG TPA: class I SAM-dependent methyltransferase [Polyangiaceae bacterium]|nr:class I SAM-dependent methyltransferase [Polyangiaceae bacterium]